VVFWGGLGAGLAVFGLLVGQGFYEELDRTARWWMPPVFARLVVTPLSNPAVAGLLIALTGIALETAVGPVRRRWSAGSIGWSLRLLRAPAVGISAVVGITMLASAVVSFPTLPHIDVHNRPPLADYVNAVVLATMTNWRLADHDFLTSVTFRGAFGWVDTLMPAWFLSTAAFISAVPLLCLPFVRSLWSDRRRMLLFGLAAAAIPFVAAAYGAASYLLGGRNVHGRYLIGLYVAIQMLGCAIAAAPTRSEERRPAKLTAAALVVVAALHGIALSTILLRYF
jgi:hypothetical protein